MGNSTEKCYNDCEHLCNLSFVHIIAGRHHGGRISSMIRIQRELKKKRGQAMVEFALVLPVFILLLMGIMEFGLIFHQYLVVTAASREGARAAAVGGTDAEVEVVAAIAAASVDKGLLQTTVTPATRVKGTSVTVSVTNPVTISTPLIAVIFPANPLPVTGTTVMRME